MGDIQPANILHNPVNGDAREETENIIRGHVFKARDIDSDKPSSWQIRHDATKNPMSLDLQLE
eukprot:12450562-Ditylum_brightwellii.AAC.1